jgi:hypothetical protein
MPRPCLQLVSSARSPLITARVLTHACVAVLWYVVLCVCCVCAVVCVVSCGVVCCVCCDVAVHYPSADAG